MIACARGWDERGTAPMATPTPAPRLVGARPLHRHGRAALHPLRRVMKRALPMAAFAVIAAVLAFFFVARQPRQRRDDL